VKAPISLVVFLLLALCFAFGQAQTEQTPKPGPEVLKLGYYVGTWEGHGETEGGPLGPAGKLSSKMTCEWFAGGFQVVCRGEETGPTGKREFLNIKSYDEKTKSYTEYAISSLGESEHSLGGSLVGDKLTYISDVGEGDKTAKIRYTEEHVSPVLLTYKAEAALGGGPWMTIAEGKITKVK
jgi:uncharacterized protein DUF1579